MSQDHVRPPSALPCPNSPQMQADLELAEEATIASVGVPSFSKELQDEKSTKTQELDSISHWDTDPANPRNWSLVKKWVAVTVVSVYGFVGPLTSSMMAPSLPQVAEKYHIMNSTVTALTLSIFLLSFAIGPLVLAPLTEAWGRRWVLHIGNYFSIAFNLGCAYAPTTGALIGLRFLVGFSSGIPMAVGSAIVSDVFAPRERATAMSCYTIGPLLGPVFGPVAGGFIAQYADVKYVFICLAAICGLVGLGGTLFLEETYAPVIRLRIAKKSGNRQQFEALRTNLQMDGGVLKMIWVNVTRPLIYLTRSFICFILSLYMAFMYGTYYLMFATFADFFHDTYGFQPGVGGLTYLGLGLGFLAASFVSAGIADRIYRRLSEKNHGRGTPEMRVPPMFPGCILVPIGLFWYGWSAQAKIHWIMPIIGTTIFSFGMVLTFLPISLYLVDTFPYAASATAASAFFRSLLGFTFPLFGKQMFTALGMGGGNSLLGGLAIVLGVPFPVWIYYKGESMRARGKYTRTIQS